MRVCNLRKVYRKGFGDYTVAVDRISFGMVNGDVFTLLGVNGSGKTSTFKVLTGEIIATGGTAHIMGYDV